MGRAKWGLLSRESFNLDWGSNVFEITGPLAQWCRGLRLSSASTHFTAMRSCLCTSMPAFA
eukprot:6367572-Lingulodinium_polyedra.AAC.1